MKKSISIKLSAFGSSGEVSGILNIPDNAIAVLIFAHGAGAPMDHPFMNKMASYLYEEGIGTLRYNFPYTERKQKRIDSAPVLKETVRSVVETAKQYTGEVPMFAGGKSMGGRMTSQAASENPLEGIKGIVFIGFPLHAPGKDSTERAEHLYKVNIPMLFLQGTRDKLANLDLLGPIVSELGGLAELHIIQGADHSFHMLKSSGKSDDEILREVSARVKTWIKRISK